LPARAVEGKRGEEEKIRIGLAKKSSRWRAYEVDRQWYRMGFLFGRRGRVEHITFRKMLWGKNRSATDGDGHLLKKGQGMGMRGGSKGRVV